MQPDFERTASAMIAGAQKAIALAVSPLIERAEAAERRADALEQRLAELETRELPEAIKGDPGRDADMAEVERMVAERVKAAVAEIPAPENGKDGAGIVDFVRGENGHVVVTLSNGATRDLGSFKGDPGERGPEGPEGPQGERGEKGLDGAHAALEDVLEAVAPKLAEEVQKAVAALPVPKDGKDGEQGPPGERGPQGEKGDPGEKGEPGINGRDVDDITVTQDGRTVEFGFTVGDTRTAFELELPEGIRGEKGEPGIDGRDGVDGRSITKADIDQNGELSITYSDGTVEKAGTVKGEKGDPGSDGLGFEDVDEVLDEDGRTVIRTYRRGEHSREFRHKFAVPLYKGVHREGHAYEKSDTVTSGKATWIALNDTRAKPGTNEDWKIIARAGRDGKDGKNA